jgi:hypothetical protein
VVTNINIAVYGNWKQASRSIPMTYYEFSSTSRKTFLCQLVKRSLGNASVRRVRPVG